VTLIARASRPADWLPIETLNRASRRALPKLWWWEEYLSDELFVVVERGPIIVGALFAWPDESSVAWVRLASVLDQVTVDDWLDAALPVLLPGLRRRGTRYLAWMDYWDWAGPHLAARGFHPLTDVETLIKTDHALPAPSNMDAVVRPAAPTDIVPIARVDALAFDPHWRNSRATVERRFRASPLFIVAEVAGSVVGYADGEVRPPTAHLNRVAVHPEVQGRGIGEAIVHHALCRCWRDGAERVTLNTQAHNLRARRLYRRLGFEPTGERATAWELDLSPRA
jgi:ribosomal-protein-alanine N-acetyltransferase